MARMCVLTSNTFCDKNLFSARVMNVLLHVVIMLDIGIIGPLGINSLVQVHQDSVLLRNLTIKDTLHVTMCSQGFLDMTSPTILSSQLHGFEPVDVLSVEEHEPHRADSLVHLEWVT